MADYTEFNALDPEVQARILELATMLRPLMGELARMLNHADAMNALYNAEGSAALALLSGSDDIPNPTGASSASALTKDQTVSLVAYAQNLLTSYNTAPHRQNYARAAGATNLIG